MNISIFISCLAVFILAPLTMANEVKSKLYVVPGVGEARLTHEELGEPISAPERIKVTIKCNKSGQTKQVALFRVCRLEEYEFDESTKSLRLKMVSGRVILNSGEVVCDQIDHKEIDFSKACN